MKNTEVTERLQQWGTLRVQGREPVHFLAFSK
jgi:hypothetical protein